MKKIQIIRQTEAAECGLACIAMIANYHGHEFDLATLRTRYPTSNRGMQLTTLLETASKLGLQTKAVKVELSYLKKIKTPCVLHWGLDHYVVLESVSGNGIKIFDPAKGVSKLSYDMASDLFTGIAVIFSKAESFEPQRGKSELSLVSLISSSVGLKQTLWKILILSVSLEMLALMIPFYFQWVLDNSIGAGQEAVISSVSAGFLLITLIFSMLYFCRGWVLAKVGTETNALWSTALYRHLLRLPLSWFEKRYKGDILTKFDSLRVVQATLTGQAVSALIDGCISLLILSLAFVYDTQMATILTICFASYACARFFIIKCVRQRTEELIINRGMAQQEVVDSLIGIMPIKLNHKYSMREVRHRKCVDKVSDNDFRLQVLGVLVGALNQALPVVTRILIVWVGAFKVIDGALSLGMLIGIIAYVELFFIRATLSLDKCSELWVVKAHLARVSDIVLTPRTQVREGVLVKSLDRFDIEVAGLAFRYSDDIDWVLRDVSFKVEEGQSVALVGKSGCGKSTLSKLILGLMPAAAGKVLIGGIPVNFIEEETIGSIVGSVTQDDKLFSGTILDNISFWDHQVTFEKVKAAAELAKVSLEIERLPMGYHTLVGDMGASLSGGQTQRILLARALYKKPKILLLDEATSNLDVALERSVNEAIGNLAITRIIIAHRPETIRSADLIIDLEYLNQTSRLRHEDRL